MKRIWGLVQEEEGSLKPGAVVEIDLDEYWGLDEFIQFPCQQRVWVSYNGRGHIVTKSNLRDFWIFDEQK